MKSLTDILKELEKEGYKRNLKSFLMSRMRSNRLQPKSFIVDKWFRIDEMSDPSAQTVVYALSSKDPATPLKGFLVNGYGIYSDPNSDQILEELELNPESSVDEQATPKTLQSS